MIITLQIIAMLMLLGIIYFLGSYLRHSFQADRKGLPPYINTYPWQRYLFRTKLHIPAGSSILDLGCGDGSMLRLFIKEYKCKKAIGYDINPFAIRRGRFLNKLYGVKNIALIHDDIYHADVSGFDYIYLYLFSDFIEKLEPRIFDRMDHNTILICNTFKFTDHTPFKIIHDKHGKERLFLYKK